MNSGIGTRYFKNRILLTAVTAAALFIGGNRAFAGEPYLLNFNATYSAYGTALDTCKLCHPGYPLSDARNSFGSDFANALIGNHTFNTALEGTDSDGDGFSNFEEINALTFPGDPASMPPTSVTISALSINGASSVQEGDTASYEASASWSDGSTTTVPASWTVSPDTFAMIDASGVLTAFEVTSDQTVTVAAVFDGTTASKTVTIVNMPASEPPLPAAGISLMPEDGAVDIPVTTVVVVTGDGTTDIAAIVNETTFSLSVGTPGGADSLCNCDPNCVAGGIVKGTIGYNDSHTEATFTPLCKLEHAMTYTATVDTATGASQPVPGESVRSAFTTIARTPDSDGDGVGDGEDDHPHDNGRATPPCVRGSGKFLVDTYGNAGNGLMNITLVDAEGISDMYPQFRRQGKPFGFAFPDGLVRYTLKGVPPGGTVTVTVSFPSGVPKGSKVFKVGTDGFRESTNAVVEGNKVTVTLTDGGDGDADGRANGVIVDPLGVAVPAGGEGSGEFTSTVSASGGCSVSLSGGGRNDALGSFGLVVLVWLGILLRRRNRSSHPARC